MDNYDYDNESETYTQKDLENQNQNIKDLTPSEVQWLTEQFESKKKSLQIEKKMNHSYKVQFNILENKLKARNSLKESKNDSNSDNDINNNNKTQSFKSSKITSKSVNLNLNYNVSNNLYMSLEDQINKIKKITVFDLAKLDKAYLAAFCKQCFLEKNDD